MKLTEMIQRMDEPDKTRAYRAQISGFDGSDSRKCSVCCTASTGGLYLTGFAGEPAADCIDRTVRHLQDRPPGGLECDRRSPLGKGGSRRLTAESLPLPEIRTMNRAKPSSHG